MVNTPSTLLGFLGGPSKILGAWLKGAQQGLGFLTTPHPWSSSGTDTHPTELRNHPSTQPIKTGQFPELEPPHLRMLIQPLPLVRKNMLLSLFQEISLTSNLNCSSAFERCVLASMKVTTSSLLPTAMVCPSGLQQMLMFSPGKPGTLSKRICLPKILQKLTWLSWKAGQRYLQSSFIKVTANGRQLAHKVSAAASQAHHLHVSPFDPHNPLFISNSRSSFYRRNGRGMSQTVKACSDRAARFGSTAPHRLTPAFPRPCHPQATSTISVLSTY